MERRSQNGRVPLAFDRTRERRPQRLLRQRDLPVFGQGHLDSIALDVALALVDHLRQCVGDRLVEPLVAGEDDVRVVDREQVLADAGEESRPV